jgi:hypothetical protein
MFIAQTRYTMIAQINCKVRLTQQLANLIFRSLLKKFSAWVRVTAVEKQSTRLETCQPQHKSFNSLSAICFHKSELSLAETPLFARAVQYVACASAGKNSISRHCCNSTCDLAGSELDISAYPTLCIKATKLSAAQERVF